MLTVPAGDLLGSPGKERPFSGVKSVELRFGDHIGIRLEARLFGTFVNSSSALWCGGGSGGGGCSFGFSGDVLWQYEATAGLTFIF